ncbi:MAG: hypothetical protein ACLP01_28830 [Solirubrobacteraceae bacterium]
MIAVVRWRVVIVVGCVVMLLAGVAGAAVASARAVGSWSAPAVIVSPLVYVGDPQVAVSGSGRAVVVWMAGTPPVVCVGGPGLSCPPTSFSDWQVMAATGTLPGPLGAPTQISAVGADIREPPFIAVSGSGVEYLVWPQGTAFRWMLSIGSGGVFSRPRALGIPDGAQLQGLVAGGGGPVAAVWLQYGVHSAPALRYATLSPARGLGPVITVADLGSPLDDVKVAVNDRGELVAAWTNSGAPFGNRPRVSAEFCDRDGRCGPRLTVAFRHQLSGQYGEVHVTLSDGGTAAVFVGLYDPASDGLQAAVSRDGRPFVASTTFATGAHAVAAAVGENGAVAVFNVGGIPVKDLALSRLTAGSTSFTRPSVFDRRTVGSPVVAGAPNGDYLLAWFDAPVGLITATSYSLHAALGAPNSPSRPVLIAPGTNRLDGGQLATAIDDHGHAIILWDDWLANQPAGLFAATATITGDS